MVDAFCATWKLIDSQNFDEYMKALGKFFCFLLEENNPNPNNRNFLTFFLKTSFEQMITKIE